MEGLRMNHLKNMTVRQRELSRAIKSDLKETNNLNDSLADSAALLITQIEEANAAIKEHGVLIVGEGSRKQQVFKENPAVQTREKAIKQLNILARTLNVNIAKIQEQSDLSDFLKGE